MYYHIPKDVVKHAGVLTWTDVTEWKSNHFTLNIFHSIQISLFLLWNQLNLAPSQKELHVVASLFITPSFFPLLLWWVPFSLRLFQVWWWWNTGITEPVTGPAVCFPIIRQNCVTHDQNSVWHVTESSCFPGYSCLTVQGMERVISQLAAARWDPACATCATTPQAPSSPPSLSSTLSLTGAKEIGVKLGQHKSSQPNLHPSELTLPTK